MINKKISVKKFLPLGILLISLLITIFAITKIVGLLSSNQKSSASVSRVSVVEAKAIANLNKDFNFPLKDSTGKKITDVKFHIDNAELRDEIIVKGQRATAIQGRTFLILNLKMTSTFTKGLQINSKDYFRLTMNGNEADMLAPDINNDPVLVEPTSTKLTRVGWAINDTDKNLIMSVGEVGGEKTRVAISF